jgi:hypothetical protein
MLVLLVMMWILHDCSFAIERSGIAKYAISASIICIK